jgi:hypothetical protein
VSTQLIINPTSGQGHRALTNELSVRYDDWVELYPQSLSVVRGARANILVARIVGFPSSIPNGGLDNPVVLRRRIMLQEDMFDPPETPSRET